MSDKEKQNESIPPTDKLINSSKHNLNSMLENELLDKVKLKRFKQITPTKAVDITNPGSSSSSSTPSDERLPLWVAGASPAKFISLEDIVKINTSLEKMAIVHEIAIDPEFSVEDLKNKDKVYNALKVNMHKAFWDVLRDEISKDPPNYNHAFLLLNDLKDLVTEQLKSSNLNNALLAVEEILDFNHLKSLFDRKMLDFKEVLKLILQVLQRLCAPIRDDMIKKLKCEEDLVDLFRGIFELLELMKIDMTNFTLSQNRGTIENYSAQIEREEFMKALEIDPSGSQNTKFWLEKIFNEYKANSLNFQLEKTNNTLSNSVINDLIILFYLKLLENNSCLINFPETLKLDQNRFMALSEKFLQLILTTSAIFITSNLAGRSVCENPKFKTLLKNELIIILNNVTWNNYIERLENVFLQCEKNVKIFNLNWNDEKSLLLRNQINDLKSQTNQIWTIAKTRICTFLQLVLSRTGGQLKLPSGLSIIQSELSAFTSKLYTIVIHNWNTFGTFYTEILNNYANKQN